MTGIQLGIKMIQKVAYGILERISVSIAIIFIGMWYSQVLEVFYINLKKLPYIFVKQDLVVSFLGDYGDRKEMKRDRRGKKFVVAYDFNVIL